MPFRIRLIFSLFVFSFVRLPHYENALIQAFCKCDSLPCSSTIRWEGKKNVACLSYQTVSFFIWTLVCAAFKIWQESYKLQAINSRIIASESINASCSATYYGIALLYE